MFVIAVADLAVSVEYYRRVLGFTVHEIGDAGWRIFERDGCRIMAGDCPGTPPARDLGNHSYIGYVEVEGIDDLYAEFVAAGATLKKPLRDEPWGMREFALETIDGHRFMFGCPLGR